MTRLIDADALKKENERLLHCDFPYLSEMTLEELIDDAPTIDAVPVIRCKECKYRDPEDKKCDCGHSIQWNLPRSDEWFCADAERRGEE